MSSHGGSLGMIITFWPRFQVRKRTRHLCWTSGKVKYRDLVVPLWKVSLITVIGSYPSDLCSQKVVNSFYIIFIEKEGKRRGKLGGNIFLWRWISRKLNFQKRANLIILRKFVFGGPFSFKRMPKTTKYENWDSCVFRWVSSYKSGTETSFL